MIIEFFDFLEKQIFWDYVFTGPKNCEENNSIHVLVLCVWLETCSACAFGAVVRAVDLCDNGPRFETPTHVLLLFV